LQQLLLPLTFWSKTGRDNTLPKLRQAIFKTTGRKNSSLYTWQKNIGKFEYITGRAAQKILSKKSGRIPSFVHQQTQRSIFFLLLLFVIFFQFNIKAIGLCVAPFVVSTAVLF
jgi:hypothetical protein